MTGRADKKRNIIVISDEDDDLFANVPTCIMETKKQKCSKEDLSHLLDDSDDALRDIELPQGFSKDKNEKKTKKSALTILSWNIDGLEDCGLEERTKSAIKIIKDLLPDVVLLQEVVDSSLSMIFLACSCRYEIRTEMNPYGYFNAILIMKNPCVQVNGEVKCVHFRTSQMQRLYLLQELTVDKHTIVVMTTHLESCKEHATERQKQLKTCFDVMLSTPETDNVVFAGDLNLRAEDLRKVGGIPATISDAWESTGENLDTKFTWDLELNDNKQFDWGKPRARYDRMYFRRSKSKPPIQCVDFRLIGTERLNKPSCKMFPSDHFGIFATFLMTND